MVGLRSALFPPAPTFTEKDLPSLSGKVVIITGAASGVGFELSKILYSKGGTIYIAARSEKRCNDAIAKIKTDIPKSTGTLMPMVIDVADLATIKPAVETFLKQENRLDVLIHNAGIMEPPAGSKTKLGHDLEIGTHCLGPFVLTNLLQDVMCYTAKLESSKPYRVRIVFVTSLLQLGAPPGGVQFDEHGAPKVLKAFPNYMESKVGCAWLAHEYAKRLDKDKILCMSVHPGLMRTDLQRTMPAPARALMSVLFKPAVYGAYSELFTAFSPVLTAKDNGGYVIAWGRLEKLPDDIANAMKSKEEGGNNGSQSLWDYCERETMNHV